MQFLKKMYICVNSIKQIHLNCLNKSMAQQRDIQHVHELSFKKNAYNTCTRLKLKKNNKIVLNLNDFKN